MPKRTKSVLCEPCVTHGVLCGSIRTILTARGAKRVQKDAKNLFLEVPFTKVGIIGEQSDSSLHCLQQWYSHVGLGVIQVFYGSRAHFCHQFFHTQPYPSFFSQERYPVRRFPVPSGVYPSPVQDVQEDYKVFRCPQI